jgi:hypothetical protein
VGLSLRPLESPSQRNAPTPSATRPAAKATVEMSAAVPAWLVSERLWSEQFGLVMHVALGLLWSCIATTPK